MSLTEHGIGRCTPRNHRGRRYLQCCTRLNSRVEQSDKLLELSNVDVNLSIRPFNENTARRPRGRFLLLLDFGPVRNSIESCHAHSGPLVSCLTAEHPSGATNVDSSQQTNYAPPWKTAAAKLLQRGASDRGVPGIPPAADGGRSDRFSG